MPHHSAPPPDAITRTLASLKWAALVTAFTVGGAWVDTKKQIDALRDKKLDATTYYVEATKRDAAIAALAASLRRIEQSTAVTEARVAEMFCADQPRGRGCR